MSQKDSILLARNEPANYYHGYGMLYFYGDEYIKSSHYEDGLKQSSSTNNGK